ncbi:16S rRNA (guanine(966)-N(2))-methyltransferase RsmD [Caldibacillus debilis]|uniref:RNA methyltransferase, RsmD family n=1 Tax=Caldibacillus debilis GB1 TaxID=1339248 RepID=A0A420VJT6_9BACI|nr:16S rRNA (guanine(966)-N(2))-methyltransferase RsmD [Caldibacillus debilis]RKO63865.1 RNA methyltransferase, RsmD family [Caldibacillus debilis GB1]
MRVISGSKKGRKLHAVPGWNTRPTADRVKEAIFNMIGPYFSGGMGLDLFAGSGALGIEGLSRGLDKVIFVDHDRNAVQTIKRNLELCDLAQQAEVFKTDWKRALASIARRKLSFQVIWCDPPYQMNVYREVMAWADQQGTLAEEGVLVCEHKRELPLPEKCGDLIRFKHGEYGITAVSVYIKMGGAQDGTDCRLSGQF